MLNSFPRMCFLLLLVGMIPVHSYTMGYLFRDGQQSTIVNSGVVLDGTLDAEHIADLYARLAGLSPIFTEAKHDLPRIDMFSSLEIPLLIELVDKAPDDMIQAVVISDSNNQGGEVPNLKSVLSVLRSYGLPTTGRYINVTNTHDISWLHAQSAPIVFLQKEFSTLPATKRRNLNGDDAMESVTPLTEDQISQYQIFLWVSIGIILLLLTGVFMVANMDVVPDSLLYAKFQSSRIGKHD